MGNDLFSEQDDVIIVDPNKDYLDELVGDGKKFKDTAALARAKVESDAFIERLKKEKEKETAALRAALDERDKIEDVVDKAFRRNESVNQNQPDGTERADLPQTPDVSTLVQQEFDRRTDEANRRQNVDFCKQKLAEAYGEGFQNVANSKARTLGTSVEYLAALAETQPNLFLSLMLPQKAGETFVAPPRGSVQSAPPSGEQPRTLSWYKKQYPNPKDYWNASVQNEIHKQAQKLGADFFDAP